MRRWCQMSRVPGFDKLIMFAFSFRYCYVFTFSVQNHYLLVMKGCHAISLSVRNILQSA